MTRSTRRLVLVALCAGLGPAAAAGPLGGASADVAVYLGAFPSPVLVQTTITYTIGVYNLGPDTATSVTVTDPLPPGSTFLRVLATPEWSCGQALGLVTCTRPSISFIGLTEITVEATAPAAPGPLTNTVTVTHGEPDPDPSNDTASVTSTITTELTTDLGILKVGEAEARWGQPFTWTITARNHGPYPVAGATVRDVFPAAVSGVGWACVPSAGASCPSVGTGDIDVQVDLPVQGTATFTATGIVQPGTAGLMNFASITVPPGAHDPYPINDGSVSYVVAGPIRYYPVTPCRLVDTRTTQSPLVGGTTRSFAVGGLCGVPVGARAAAVNATAVNPEGVGNLRIYPAGQTTPPTASTLNFVAGKTRANLAVLALGPTGHLQVQCDMSAGASASTHFVLDVFGYFR